MVNKQDYLKTIKAFETLPSDAIAEVDQQTKMVRYRAGHLFYVPDDPGEVLFILKDGRVQLYRMSADGRKIVMALLNPGAIFGHMALVGQRLHNTFAQALDECLICVWDRSQVERVLIEKPEVALRFLDAVGQRLMQAEQRLEDITFRRVSARLAALLLQLEAEAESQGILRGYTHQYLADMLGTYRETATQTLNEFKSQNWIRIGRKTIEILDVEGLKACAAT